ncbi:bestrophin-4-like isoform X2 [Rhynchophorus ferrugineus]|uniref:bestrophin-4-like isoform X2 n=1 Tax=Rhynchophorus ferrugineus TaxID=354439 RepID=UPI003FCD061A
MTVIYSREVSTSSRGIGKFLKLLFRWRGSIYKIVWFNLFLYLVVYYGLKLLFMYGVTDLTQRNTIIKLSTYFSKSEDVIPLSFVLGFFVNVVYTRWWSQFCTIPEPDGIALQVSATVIGNEDMPRMIRRTIMRYVVLSFTMTLTMISPRIKKRFPTYEHLVEAGLLTDDEKKLIEEFQDCQPKYAMYWLPISWAVNLAVEAKSEKLIEGEIGLEDLVGQLNKFREKCKMLTYYDWVCIPLVYTQLVTFAVYLYFLFTIIGEQFIEESSNINSRSFMFPFMNCLKFFFYMGWLKVAESMINPFGEDDDDFDINWMIDRNLQVGYWIVDKNQNKCPRVTKDYHWDKPIVSQLPFTKETAKYKCDHPVSSTRHIELEKTRTYGILGKMQLIPKRHNSKASLNKVTIDSTKNEDED